MFKNAQCSLLRAETFSYNLNVLHRGLNIKTLYKKLDFLSRLQNITIFVYKDPGLGSAQSFPTFLITVKRVRIYAKYTVYGICIAWYVDTRQGPEKHGKNG
jgi:hypothetical protein